MQFNATQSRPNKYTKGTIAVYRIRNAIIGQSYVGSSAWVEDRFKEHRRQIRHKCSSASRLRQASNTYGLDDFAFEILETFDHPDDLVDAENRWIMTLDTHRHGYTQPEKLAVAGP